MSTRFLTRSKTGQRHRQQKAEGSSLTGVVEFDNTSFQKKSTTGIKTSKVDVDVIRSRLKQLNEMNA